MNLGGPGTRSSPGRDRRTGEPSGPVQLVPTQDPDLESRVDGWTCCGNAHGGMGQRSKLGEHLFQALTKGSLLRRAGAPLFVEGQEVAVSRD